MNPGDENPFFFGGKGVCPTPKENFFDNFLFLNCSEQCEQFIPQQFHRVEE